MAKLPVEQPREIPRLDFLYVEIGRGHPFYLDGIMEALVRKGRVGMVRESYDVFRTSSGLSLSAWQLLRRIYLWGGSRGLTGWAYRHLRNHGRLRSDSLLIHVLGRDVRKRFGAMKAPLVVSHPVIVAALGNSCDLIYQHGELVAPPESLVVGAASVIVPTEEVAAQFVHAGYHKSQLCVAGLCVEPALVRQADDAFPLRRSRLMSGEQLTGAFFSSGAEPTSHIRRIVGAAESVVNAEQRAIIFAQRGGKLALLATRCFSNPGELLVIDASSVIPAESPPVTLVITSSRREESALTARLFSVLDYFVAPAHERTSWAAGLGLPMFVVSPDIGPFAPLNRELALSLGVAKPLSDEPGFGEALNRSRGEGRLQQMADAGWRKRPINGFEVIADWLIHRLDNPSSGEPG